MKALALIIGNADYPGTNNRLVNAVNDATDFSNTLLKLGFVTKLLTDCTRQQFEEAVREYAEELKGYDVGLFYFSGHGLQIDGVNYLTSLDTGFFDASTAKHTSYSLSHLIEYMQEAAPSVKILILDACRDNPLRTDYRGLGMQGLAPIYAPKGTLIAFSTSPGEKARDYGMGSNSVYTGALLNHINDENIPIEEFFKRVRTSVHDLTDGHQTSWEHTSLIGDFTFNSGQMIHSVDLPYKDEYVADVRFVPGGGNIDQVIKKLKSGTWSTQKEGIADMRRIPVVEIDPGMQFLFGRNLLQTAEGGEFSAQNIFKNLADSLRRYNNDGVNHVLNGILFEVYFNSNGRFRFQGFKCQYIKELFALLTTDEYQKSLEFIRTQLAPFREHLFCIPQRSPLAFPIEVQFEVVEVHLGWLDATEKVHQLLSIKHAGVELFQHNPDDRRGSNRWSYDEFETRIAMRMCMPDDLIRVSMNVQKSEIAEISTPWEFRLSRFPDPVT